jgi:hypothetical protein
MSDPLDDLIRRLDAAPTDRPLGQLEAELSRDIRLQRREARVAAALAPAGAAAVALALAIGVAVGGVTAAAAASSRAGMDGLTTAGRLAPSTLLEGGE